MRREICPKSGHTYAGVLLALLVFLPRKSRRSGFALVALEQSESRRRLQKCDAQSSQHSKGDRRRTREFALFCLWCYLSSWLSGHICPWSRWLSAHRYRGVPLQIPSRQALPDGAGMVPGRYPLPHGRDGEERSTRHGDSHGDGAIQGRETSDLLAACLVGVASDAGCRREVDMSTRRRPEASDKAVLTCGESTQHQTARCEDYKAHGASLPQRLFHAIGWRGRTIAITLFLVGGCTREAIFG